MEQESQQRWEGNVSAQLKNATADQIWLIVKDFFNLHKWLPSLSTCYGVQGSNGEPGCIRYCAGFSISSEGSEKSGSWSKERLVAIDHVNRSLSYEIVDCNIGFKSYKSTIKVVPGVNDGDGQGGCVIHWFFTVDPVEGWALEDLVNKYDVGLQSMAIKMEDEIANSVDAERSMAEEKWEGKASVEVGNSGADQVWTLIEDFCNLHRWIPIDTCYQVEGAAGQPGLIRHCTSTTRVGDETKILWAKEKLVEIDPIQRYLSYEILDNNLGMGSYAATMRVLAINGDGSNDIGRGCGCRIQWSFVCDPIQGQTFQEFMSYIESCLQFMGNKMELHFSTPTQL